MVEQGDYPSHADHGAYGSKPDTHQSAGTCQSDQDCGCNIEGIKAVFGKAHLFSGEIRDGLHNAVPRIGNQAHVQGHSSSDARQGNGNEKNQDPLRQGTARKIREIQAEEIHKTGKYQAQRELKDVHEKDALQV